MTDNRSDPLAEREACTADMRAHLARAKALRAAALSDPALAQARIRLRTWQAERLARTHADLLASPRYGPPASFFLSDLYGPKDFSHRDEEVERILPTLSVMLPVSALRGIAAAIDVDALSEELDAALLEALQRAGKMDRLDDDAYAAAYRACANRALRERQIALIDQVGHILDRLTRTPLFGTALHLMRVPAMLAGLSELHEFLDGGYTAFRHMGDADEFLQTILERETALMNRLFRGVPDPFAPPPPIT